MTSHNPIMIEATDIDKQFVLPNETVHALKSVSFKVPHNSFTLIYGPSGSGKSTLLNILVGLDEPTSGRIVINDQDLYTLDRDERANFRARTLGMVYQTNYWVNSLSVLQNVSMPLYLAGYSYKEAAKLAEEKLVRVGMQDYMKQHPTVLSGGQQQRVSMARALVANPDLIVADEPTGNLDTKNGDMIMSLLSELKNEMNKTIILVTHNLEYLPLSDYRIRIKDGLLIEETGGGGLLDSAAREAELKRFQQSAKQNFGSADKKLPQRQVDAVEKGTS